MSIAIETRVRELAREMAELKIIVAKLAQEPRGMNDLKAEYEKRFGKPPHHLMKAETIARELER